MSRFGSELVRPWWYVVFVCICICICICVTRWVRSEWLMTMPASLWMGASQTLLTSVLGVRDAIFTTNVWEELLTSVWKSGTSLRFYILAQPTPLWCYVSFDKARSPLNAWINLNLFGVMLSFWPMSFISLPPEGVMIRWQQKHIWLWWQPGNLFPGNGDGRRMLAPPTLSKVSAYQDFHRLNIRWSVTLLVTWPNLFERWKVPLSKFLCGKFVWFLCWCGFYE